jgi:hypothetical protein
MGALNSGYTDCLEHEHVVLEGVATEGGDSGGGLLRGLLEGLLPLGGLDLLSLEGLLAELESGLEGTEHESVAALEELACCIDTRELLLV